MKYYPLELILRSPLALRADHALDGARTAKIIPGSAFAGSLAGLHRLLRPEAEREFTDLFISGGVSYPFFYPSSFNLEYYPGLDTAEEWPVYPLPRTAQTCKKHPGFPFLDSASELDENPHGVRDTLLDWGIFALLEKRMERELETYRTLEPKERAKGASAAQQKYGNLMLADFRQHEHCPRCRGNMDSYRDIFYRQIGESREYASAHVPTAFQTHTGINRSTGTVQNGILYNRQVIQEGARFRGTVRVPDTLVEPFDSFLEEIIQYQDEGEDLVHLGAGKTRGLGAIRIKSIASEKPPEYDTFYKRVASLNYYFLEQARKLEPNLAQGTFFFAVTLHSPTILRDEWLNYRGLLPSETLAQRLNVKESDLGLLHMAAELRRMRGWMELWHTPRPNEYAIDTGSAFFYTYTGEANDGFYRRLFALEEEGLGERRSEGFGRVMISDPFHLKGALS